MRALVLGWMVLAGAAEARRLTLGEAMELAMRQNRGLKLARLKAMEHRQKQAVARSEYFPELKHHTTLFRTTAEQQLEIPAGAFGVYGATGPVPGQDLVIRQGGQTLLAAGTTLAQPLTPLIRIRQANRIAGAEVAASEEEVKRAEQAVAVRVQGLYFGLLIGRRRAEAAALEVAAAGERRRESEQDVREGSALRVAVIEGQAAELEREQALLEVKLRNEDLQMEMNEAIGLPLDTVLELAEADGAGREAASREEYVAGALAGHPEVRAAAETVRQAQAGVTAARSAYVPDIAVFARHNYQNGVPFLVHNFGTFGASLSYDVFDFGKRRAVVRERLAKLAQAEENLARVRERVQVEIDSRYHQAEQARHRLRVAERVAALRAEGERLAENQVREGAAVGSARQTARAASAKAKADLLAAQLAQRLAVAELEQAAGRMPGQ